jgi:multidrug resistance efflux pump
MLPKNADKSDETENAPIGIRTLWAGFRTADGDDFFRYWLAIQATLIGNVAQGLLVIGAAGNGPYAPMAHWAAGEADPQRLTDICENVLDQRCGLLAELPPAQLGTASGRYAVAYPLLIDDLLYGAVALEVAAADEAGLAPVMEQLQWGVAWLELQFRRDRNREDATSLAGMRSSFDLLAAVVSEKHFAAASRVFVTELALLTRSDRVSLGLMKRGRIQIQTISHSARFDKNVNLVRAIATAMEEAVLQKCELVYPRLEGMKPLVTRDHDELSRQQGGEAILTIPLYSNGACQGAVTFERPAELPFLENEVAVCRSIFSLVTPILEEKRLQDRLLLFKATDSLKQQAARLFGAGYVGRKLAVAALAAIILYLSVATGDYRITANAVLEPSIRRSIVSPFNGYVKESVVRPGDVVTKGKPLCTLDDRDLYLERTKLSNQITQYQRQRQEALATADRAKVNIIGAQLSQAEAQLNLVQSQLKRTGLVAPFDGIVVSGDLSQRVDGAVEQGEVLYEIAPLNSYRLILQVDEYRIDEVRPGQQGTLVLPALTGRDFPYRVGKITPLSSQKEGKNFFRVEAALVQVDNGMRPGMEGVAKIMVDRRKLVAIWTRDLVDWLRLKVWSWWP